MDKNTNVVEKKKRGRKSTKDNAVKNITNDTTENIPKKRGRKPKGGKIITKITDDNKEIHKTNIIMHLKCSLNDIQSKNDFLSITNYDPNIEDIKPFEEENNDKANFTFIDNNDNIEKEPPNKDVTIIVNKTNKNVNDVVNKIKKLDFKFHKNLVTNKKVSCFWCTYSYESPDIYIPKNKVDDSYSVYGNFCSPECACAYLTNENLDVSVKAERYHLLNYIYGKMYNYTKNIKPAPNPYYTLDKYYGDLTIEEYRKLLEYDRFIIVIDKPLTKNTPEIHLDKENYELNNTLNSINSYKENNYKCDKNKKIHQNFGL